MTKTQQHAIEQAVRDYFEGWFEGDVTRMDRALHADLVKRQAGAALGITTKQRMLELTAAHEGKDDVGDGTLEITVEDVCDDVASVTVRGGIYHEYVHLVDTGDGWKIANALWRYR